LALALVLALLLGSCEAAPVQQDAQTAPVQQTTQTEAELQIPDFTVYDVEGNAYKLSDFVGKPIVLNFWATWCSPCQMEMPDFNEKYLELEDQVQFLMINSTDGVQDTVEKASALIAEKGYQFPVFYDTDQQAVTMYQITALPTTYFIDADGNLVTGARGMLSAEDLQKGIDLIK